jgi:uncharacterized protein (TIGR03089 family)
MPLLGRRDPAAPLLTLYDGPARVELSGATVQNWVAKTANLLVHGHGLMERRVGLLLPLHWQLVCFLLGAAAARNEVVVASSPEHLGGCFLAFVAPEHAEAALDEDVDDVLVASGHPLGARLPSVPPLCLDAAVELPAYGDRYDGPPVTTPSVLLDGEPFSVPDLALSPADRVLTSLPPATEPGLGVLLGTLAAGGSLVLLREGDPAAVAHAERVTATAGAAVPGVREL